MVDCDYMLDAVATLLGAAYVHINRTLRRSHEIADVFQSIPLQLAMTINNIRRMQYLHVFSRV